MAAYRTRRSGRRIYRDLKKSFVLVTCAALMTLLCVGSASAAIPVEDGNDKSEAALVGTDAASMLAQEQVVQADWRRIAGEDRYGTMADISVEGFDQSEYAIVATGRNYPDALAASALAGILRCPILLTETNGLSAQTSAEITRLAAKNVIILGGTASISETVQAQIAGLGCTAERIGGQTRVETANLIAARVAALCTESEDGAAIASRALSKTCFIARSTSFPDALAASSAAYALGAPIFLAESNGALAADTTTLIQSGGYTRVIALGGTEGEGAVSQAALDAVANGGARQTARLSGANRYETAVAVANWAVGEGILGWNYAGVATGNDYPDALSAGALCGSQKSVLLLAGSNSGDSDAMRAAVSAHCANIDDAYLFGGEGALSADVLELAKNASKRSGYVRDLNYAQDVVVERLANYTMSSDAHTISVDTASLSREVKAGDAVVFEATAANPGGALVRAETVEQHGETTVIAGTALEFGEAYDSYKAGGVTTSMISCVPAEGVELTHTEAQPSEAESEIAVFADGINETDSAGGGIPEESAGLSSCSGSIRTSESEAGLAGDFEGDVDTFKVKLDENLTLEITPGFAVGLDWDWGTINSFHVEAVVKEQLTGELSYDKSFQRELGAVCMNTSIPGLVVEGSVWVEGSVSGGFTVTVSAQQSCGVKYENGEFSPVRDASVETSAQLKAKAKIGPAAAVSLNVGFGCFSVPVVDASIGGNLAISAESDLLRSETLVCMDVVCSLGAEIGIGQFDSLAHTLGLKWSQDIGEVEVARLHFENGVRVESCTWKKTDAAVKTSRYTVLVLDTSGTQRFYTNETKLIYTADSSLSYVRQSAKTLANSLLSPSGRSYVAVVSYPKSGSSNKEACTICGFTNNLTELETAIDGLASSGGPNIAAGLAEAENLISTVYGDNASKNVILCGTGMTNSGEYSSTGKYNSLTVGSSWYNMSTDVKLYKYANYALQVADILKQEATLYSLGIFQKFEGMPSEGKSIAQFFRLTAKDLASSTETYYEVEDPNDIPLKFEAIAGDVKDSSEGGSGTVVLEGENRYITSSAIALEAYPAGAKGAVVATGSNYPDALAASSLAGMLDYPIVLTDSNAMTEETLQSIAQLGATDFIIVGGENSVSSGVEATLSDMGSVRRISGSDRYSTADAIYAYGVERAQEAAAASVPDAGAAGDVDANAEGSAAALASSVTWSQTAVVATGTSYPDALSISGFAFKNNTPVFLCSENGLSRAAQAALANGGFTRIVIAGGENAVPESVASWISENACSNIVRLGGSDRYETSSLIAGFALENGASMNGASVATGRNYPDALAGGVLAGKGNSVILLAESGNTVALEQLSNHKSDIRYFYFLGGEDSMPQDVRDAARAAAGFAV